MKTVLRGTVLFFAIMSAITVFPASAELAQTVKTPNGDLRLGMTKDQVIKIMGKPNSPQAFDFVYTMGKSEIIVTFNDQTKKLDAVIVRGDTKQYSVSGVKIGDHKDKVIKKFGQPEISKKMSNRTLSCWYYPSKNVYFCINQKDIVDSFSMTNCCEIILK